MIRASHISAAIYSYFDVSLEFGEDGEVEVKRREADARDGGGLTATVDGESGRWECEPFFMGELYIETTATLKVRDAEYRGNSALPPSVRLVLS